MPTIQASGGPRRVIASTRDRSSGLAHSAVAAIAAEYETPMPTPVTPWAQREHREVGRRGAQQRATGEDDDGAEEQPAQPDARRQQSHEERRETRREAPTRSGAGLRSRSTRRGRGRHPAEGG